jgi:hypothetical protein
VRAFITLGQGISKLHLLQRMDWDAQVHRAAWWSRLLVTTGLVFAGLPVLGLLARHWTTVTFVKELVSAPVTVSLIFAGFVIITAGVLAAVHALCGDLEQDLGLPDAGLIWSDYYASADPVSNGPIVAAAGQAPGPGQAEPSRAWLLPGPCNQVYNSASVVFDHNRYLRNQDQLLSRLLNDLAAAAYGDSQAQPQIVRDSDLIKVGRRRHRLVLGLITARLTSAWLVAWLWLVDLGPLLKDPMNRLVHLFAPRTGMEEGLARPLAALLTTAVAYIAVIIVWRIAERYVVRRFFHTAERLGVRRQQEPCRPASHPVQERSATVI